MIFKEEINRSCSRDKKSFRTYIILPERTSHSEDILEIIAPVYLRKALKINEGDKITIEIC